MTVVEEKEFLIQNSTNSLPISLPIRLPSLEAVHRKSVIANVEHWKRIHTLAERCYRDCRTLHICLLIYKGSGDDRDRDYAASYLKGERTRFCDFCKDVDNLPEAVRHAQPIALASKVYQCFDVLTKSLTFGRSDKAFQDGLRLTEWICDWLLECLTRADAVLEKYFAYKHKEQ